MIKKCLSAFSAFIIMLCLGGVYAWSIVVPELMKKYSFTATQSQSVLSVLIFILPITMIFAEKIGNKYGEKFLGIISGLLFLTGYLISGFSKGNFYFILLGNGFLAGVGSGFGYLASLTAPVKCFPEKRGLMTGIAVSGFGLAATVLSMLINFFLEKGKDILEIFVLIGIIYGFTIIFFSFFLSPFKFDSSEKPNELKLKDFIFKKDFLKLFLGFFFGTFAGLFLVGNLKPIALGYKISNEVIIFSISSFSIANFLGRISWGFISDHLGADKTIFFSLSSQALFIILIANVNGGDLIFLLFSILCGFSFGGNFVLFARKTQDIFGIENIGKVYPYVSIGYSLGGFFGPLTGGVLFDYLHDFRIASYINGIISLMGAKLFLDKNCILNK